MTSLSVIGSVFSPLVTRPSNRYSSGFGSSATNCAGHERIPSMESQSLIAEDTCLLFRFVSPSSAMVSMYARLFSPSACRRTMSAATCSSLVILITSPTLMSLHLVETHLNPSNSSLNSRTGSFVFLDRNGKRSSRCLTTTA